MMDEIDVSANQAAAVLDDESLAGGDAGVDEIGAPGVAAAQALGSGGVEEMNDEEGGEGAAMIGSAHALGNVAAEGEGGEEGKEEGSRDAVEGRVVEDRYKHLPYISNFHKALRSTSQRRE